jgi:phosphatidylserine/phosphatidylglycerophosphate/cardiolipin synthase-like enzyme
MNADGAPMNVPRDGSIRPTLTCGFLAAFLCVFDAYGLTPSGNDNAARVETAFTPGDDIAGLIVGRIGRARRTVQVQAYLLTDRAIANALLAARRRGLEVEVIGDANQQANGGHPHLEALHRAGVRVWLDAGHAAAHDKVVILDGGHPEATVITGSYNFTRAAQHANGENVVVISGNRAITDRFVANFGKHRAESKPWR